MTNRAIVTSSFKASYLTRTEKKSQPNLHLVNCCHMISINMEICVVHSSLVEQHSHECKSSSPLSGSQTRTQNSLSGGWIYLEVVAKMYIENGQVKVKTLKRSC